MDLNSHSITSLCPCHNYHPFLDNRHFLLYHRIRTHHHLLAEEVLLEAEVGAEEPNHHSMGPATDQEQEDCRH